MLVRAPINQKPMQHIGVIIYQYHGQVGLFKVYYTIAMATLGPILDNGMREYPRSYSK